MQEDVSVPHVDKPVYPVHLYRTHSEAANLIIYNPWSIDPWSGGSETYSAQYTLMKMYEDAILLGNTSHCHHYNETAENGAYTTTAEKAVTPSTRYGGV